MNIGFEAKRFFANFTGLGNYSRFVVNALSTHYPGDSFYLYAPSAKDHTEYHDIIHRPNVRVITPTGAYSNKVFSALWRSWAISKHSSVQGLDIFHGLSQELPYGLPTHIKKVVTVHDLIFLRYESFYNPIDVKIYTKKVQHACEVADTIIAISQQTKQDICQFLGNELESKIQVVYQGVHPNFARTIDDTSLNEIKQKYDLPKRFFLSVGTIEERKNLLLLIRALKQIPADHSIPLVVVGRKTGYFKKVSEEIRKLGLNDRVIFLQNVSFKDLPGVYKLAHAFIYPSLFEGFGIPLVEAIQSGVPVITSKGSCFSEAAGPHALYADPNNPEELAQHLQTILNDENKRISMIENSRNYIKKFSPAQIASDLHSIYQNLL